MDAKLLVPMMVALGAGGLVAVVGLLVSGRKARLEARLRSLTPGGDEPAPVAVRAIARAALPKLGTHLMPTDEKEKSRLQARLIAAGMYGRQAMVAFLGVKLLMMVGPAIVGLFLGLAGLAPLRQAVLIGACLGMAGMIGPSFWLDKKKGRRQMAFRKGLPDALDVIVICVEGGLSLVGAIRRVAGDLRDVHPALAGELEIVQREVQIGQPVGEALRRFGERADLEEVRSLASVILQAERFGAGLNKSLRMHAETLRLKRQQRAEAMAQKAGTKVLFPTLLFIFPAIFVVILGPAMIQISGTVMKMGQ